MITQRKRGPYDKKAYLADLGFPVKSMRIGNKEFIHVFLDPKTNFGLNPEVKMKLRKVALEALKKKLTGVLETHTLEPGIMWRQRPPPDIGPLTIQIIKFPPNVDGNQIREYVKRCKYGVFQHMKLVAQQIPAADTPVQCLVNNFKAAKYIPELYFFGLDVQERLYIKVMAYSPGSYPSHKMTPEGLAEIEKALYTLWIRGVSLKNIKQSHMVFNRKRTTGTGPRARILDVSSAERPIKNSKNIIATSRNPLFHQFWEPPEWLVELWAHHGDEAMTAEREKVWTRAAVCEATESEEY
jgi:hypothetical protein